MTHIITRTFALLLFCLIYKSTCLHVLMFYILFWLLFSHLSHLTDLLVLSMTSFRSFPPLLPPEIASIYIVQPYFTLTFPQLFLFSTSLPLYSLNFTLSIHPCHLSISFSNLNNLSLLLLLFHFFVF